MLVAETSRRLTRENVHSAKLQLDGGASGVDGTDDGGQEEAQLRTRSEGISAMSVDSHSRCWNSRLEQ